MNCFACGHSVDETDSFCRHCGERLAQASKKPFMPRRISPQDAADYWEHFFRPFFRMAFFFFGCFFAFALGLMVVWYFLFHR